MIAGELDRVSEHALLVEARIVHAWLATLGRDETLDHTNPRAHLRVGTAGRPLSPH